MLCWRLARGMAPHLTLAELDSIHEEKQAGLTPVQIHTRLAAQRATKKIETPHLTNTRKAPKGKVYKRARVENRGRQPTFTRTMVVRMGVTRRGTRTPARERPLRERWATTAPDLPSRWAGCWVECLAAGTGLSRISDRLFGLHATSYRHSAYSRPVPRGIGCSWRCQP